MPRTLYLLRHAETLFNVQHKTQGWCDSPLTERGIEQARIAGRVMAERGMAFDHAYSSTSERCCDTLEIATREAFGEPLPYSRQKGLREIGFGVFEGKDDCLEPRGTRGEWYGRFGGETDDVATRRIVECLSGIMARPGHQSVLAVTSGGISRLFFVANQATAQDRPRLYCNCIAYVYEWDDGVFTCKEVVVPDLSSLERPGLPRQVRVAPANLSQPWTDTVAL